MKITKIHIVNFLKLHDVEINPSMTNVIVGKNKQGKTSILKAIQAAFEGKIDASSIHLGEKKAEITIELDDLNVKRTITENGSTLDVSNKEGFKVPAPQKYLDGILGTFSFNPIKFFESKPADRKKYLLNAIKLTITPEQLFEYTGEKLAGLDFSKHALEVLEDARKFYYDRRTVANAEVSKKRKSLEELSSQIPEGFDPASVSEEQIANLREAITRDEKELMRKEDNDRHIENLNARVIDKQSQIDSYKAQILNIQKSIDILELEKADVEKQIVRATEEEFDLSDENTINIAKESLSKLEGQREYSFIARKIADLRQELGEAVMVADNLDNVVSNLTKEIPAKLISEANIPVEGLTVTESDLLVNGVSLDNLSSSEQLRFALDIVRELNKTFKVINIDGIESLDKENFEAFLKEIEEDDYQYFITRVDGNIKGGIIIEDGSIKE